MDRKVCVRVEVMIKIRNSQTFRYIHVGDTVWVRNYANGSKWLRGTELQRMGQFLLK